MRRALAVGTIVLGAALYVHHMGNAPSVELVAARRATSLITSHPLLATTPEPAFKYTAIVAGATGATGRRIVEQLVSSDSCTKVIALARREVQDLRSVFPDIHLESAQRKLKMLQVDYSTDLCPQLAENLAQADPPLVAFSALGSSPGSHQVDVEYAHNFAAAVREHSVGMAVVSSQGAKAGSMVPYLSIIGEREEDFSGLFMDKPLLIARPGPLERQELAETRLKERVLGKLSWAIDHIDTRLVGKAMVGSMERIVAAGKSEAEGHDQVYVVSHKDLREIANHYN